MYTNPLPRRLVQAAGVIAIVASLAACGVRGGPSGSATSMEGAGLGTPAGSASQAAPTGSASHATPAGSASQTDISSDCLLGTKQADVEVGIADPASSCAHWIQSLAGDGLVWYPLTHMVLPGSPGTADQETMQEACDLADGAQELYVEDAGGQVYGNEICSQQEQNGWTPEGTPGPLAVLAQQGAQAQAST